MRGQWDGEPGYEEMGSYHRTKKTSGGQPIYKMHVTQKHGGGSYQRWLYFQVQNRQNSDGTWFVSRGLLQPPYELALGVKGSSGKPVAHNGDWRPCTNSATNARADADSNARANAADAAADGRANTVSNIDPNTGTNAGTANAGTNARMKRGHQVFTKKGCLLFYFSTSAYGSRAGDSMWVGEIRHVVNGMFVISKKLNSPPYEMTLNVYDDIQQVASAFVRKFNLTEGLDCADGDQSCLSHQLAGRLRLQVAAATTATLPPEGGVRVSHWSHFTLVGGATHGDFLLENGDKYVGQKLRQGHGRYEEPTLQLLLACVAPGDVVLDVGANVGAFTVPLARAVGARGRVHAFEAQPHLANLLAANVALNIRNGVAPATVVRHAVPVGARTGARVRMPPVDYERKANFAEVRLEPVTDADDAGKGSDSSNGSGIMLESVALDDVQTLGSLREQRCPTLLKVDVETMELDVLVGAAALLRRCTARLVLYLETGGVHGAIGSLAAHCRALGYRRVYHHEFADNYFELGERSKALVTSTQHQREQPMLVVARSINMVCASDETLQGRPALREELARQAARGNLWELTD
eukprot:g666.t1